MFYFFFHFAAERVRVKKIIMSAQVLRPHARPPFVATDKSENVLWAFYRLFLLRTIHNIIYIYYTGCDRSWRGKSPIRHKERGAWY